MSWSPHIQAISSKARKMLGLLYRQYQFCDSKSLIQMYISLVRPHLEYAAQVWDPDLQQNIGDIECVQKFALRICSKEWQKEYSELLDNFKITYPAKSPSLLKNMSPLQNNSRALLLFP